MRRFGWLLFFLTLAGVGYFLNRQVSARPDAGGPLTWQLKHGVNQAALDHAIAEQKVKLSVPDLLVAAQWTPSRTDRAWGQFYDWLPVPVQPWANLLVLQSPQQVQAQALWALAALGPDAAAALPVALSHVGESPELTEAGLRTALSVAPGSEAAAVACVTTLLSLDPVTRDAAARALVGSPGPMTNALTPLLAAVSRPEGPSEAEINALATLGPLASRSVPALARLLADTNRAPAALRALARMGPAAGLALPELRPLLQSKRPDEVVAALEVLTVIGPAGVSLLPEARPFLESADPMVRIVAAVAVARMEGKPEQAMKGLLREIRVRAPEAAATPWSPSHPVFQDTTLPPAEAAVWWLGGLGRDARPAVSDLVPLLDDDSRWLRVLTAWTLWRITHDPGFSVPTLRETLLNSVDPRARAFAAAAASEMGPLAVVLEPELRVASRADLRTRQAAYEALSRIPPSPN